MKKAIILLAMVIFPSLAFAQSEIKFDSEAYDMGAVTQDMAMHSFEFKNTGSSELVIEKLVPS